LLTQKAFRIDKIRAGRDKPGLLRQHLTAVNAAAGISRSTVTGNVLGSMELNFFPGYVVPGGYHFNIGSAGSATLVLQTILPPLLEASAPSALVFEGGTHNPKAPPFDFLEETFLPVIHRMGAKVVAILDRPGFYPAGGGKISGTIEPAKLLPISILERGQLRRVSAKIFISGLPHHIAEREMKMLALRMEIDPRNITIDELKENYGPANVIVVKIVSDGITEVFTSFGMKGVRAEVTASTVAAEAQAYLNSEAPVGEHLADQLLIPMVIAGQGEYITNVLTAHTVTNINTIKKFMDAEINTSQIKENLWKISVNSQSLAP
jgi:RNA 3'-terminal phosphate cyclase (ATP)